MKWRSTAGWSRAAIPSPRHPARPEPAAAAAAAWHSEVHRAALGGWSQPCAADQGLRSHFFINYF